MDTSLMPGLNPAVGHYGARSGWLHAAHQSEAGEPSL